MNKIYKVVWNTVRNCYVVGSELISSKSGRHSASNGKSSSLKVTLTVLALCGMTALGSGVAPAYAADAGAAVESQYVAVLVNNNNNSSRNTRTFGSYSYHKETVSGESYWVRDGYTIKYEENKRYPGALKDNIIKAYKNDSYTSASDNGLLKSNQIMVESSGVSTLTNVDLDDVSGGTYVGATNSGSTSTPSSFNYMIKDDNGTYVDAGKTNFSKRFKAATKNTDGTYSYKGKVIANDNLYVVDNKVGVFLTSSGKVYTGKVFGANNEVLMTTKSDSGTMYSYWGADTPDPNTKLADMTIGQFNQALEKVNNNSKAVAGDTIKEIKTTAKTDGGGTIDLVRRGQYNSATGQYEGEHKVGSGITITSRGGTNGEDVKINFSNGTTGFDVAAGSKVEAVGTKEATTGLKINGETYNISGTDYRVVANPAEGSKGIYKPDASGNIELTVQDTKTGTTSKVQLSDIASATTVTNNYNTLNTKVDAAKTTLADGKNTTVEASTAEDGHTEYKVNLNEDVKLGDTIQLNGSDGSISATSGTSSLNFNNKGLSLSNGKNSTVINGGTITVNGGESVISGTQATFGKIKLNAESGSTITGLSNTTTKYDGFATAGRAATEEQLKEVSDQASEAIETAGKGWNLTTNGAATSKTNIAPDGTVDFSSGNDNLVISNAGADLSFSLSDNLDLTNNKDKKGSVKVGENTALTDELLQVGKDVSLTASALNVGNSSLTTSALMVGGLTYINSSGLNANNRVISNVATGVADTDAVNVGQLNSAINGSKVSIKAGDGITVEKTGNQYTIKTNIKGGSTSTGTVTVTTEDNTSTSSGGSSKLPLRQMAIMETAEMAAAEATTTDAGKAITIANTDFDLKFKTDAGTTATVNNGGTVNISGDDVNVSTSSKAGTNSDTIRIALNKDIKVDSITAKTDGGQLNIKSEVNMNSQKITNLAEGDISETSTDAVNGSQLYNTNQAVIANAENINSLSHSLNKLDSRINRVGAGAAALAALHPLDFDPDNKWDFAAGYGNYAGANAVAIGTYYRPNENTMFSIGGSFGGGENMINAGVSFKLGSGGSGITTSKTVMAKKIKEQDELLKAQDAKMKEQDEKIAKLEALVAQQGEMIQQALGKK